MNNLLLIGVIILRRNLLIGNYLWFDRLCESGARYIRNKLFAKKYARQKAEFEAYIVVNAAEKLAKAIDRQLMDDFTEKWVKMQEGIVIDALFNGKYPKIFLQPPVVSFEKSDNCDTAKVALRSAMNDILSGM